MTEAGEGAETSRGVSGKLGEIAGSVGKVTEIIAAILAAAKEQSLGIEQLNMAVSDMDKVTQQNAASSEESSSAAAELSGQSEELAAMVGAFRLSGHGAEPSRVAAANGKAQDPAQRRTGNDTPLRPEEVFPLAGKTRSRPSSSPEKPRGSPSPLHPLHGEGRPRPSSSPEKPRGSPSPLHGEGRGGAPKTRLVATPCLSLPLEGKR